MSGPKPVRRPAPDTAQIETRLMVVAEMLERAVAEVLRAVAEIKGGEPIPDLMNRAGLSPLGSVPAAPARDPSDEVRSNDDVDKS